MPFGRLKFIAAGGAKLLLLLVYTALVAEVFIRLVHPQPRMPRYVTGTAWGVRGNIPNARYRHHTAEVDVGFTINGQGMRADRDYPQAKPAGTCRIAMLGDSFFMGYELNFPDTIAARLEKGLRAAGMRVEVLNFAVSGFGTAEDLRTYEAYAQHFDPDVVLLEWDRSDYDDNIRADLYRLDGGRLVATGKDFLPSVALQDALMRNPVYTFLVDHSDLYNMLREYLGLYARNLTAQISSLAVEVRARLHGRAETRPAGPPPQVFAQAWASDISPVMVDLSAALLDRFDHEVTDQRRGFYIVEIPFQYPSQRSVSSLSLLGPDRLDRLPILSSVAAFNREAETHKMFYVSGDGHITPFAVGVLLQPLLARLEHDPHLASCTAQQRAELPARQP